LDLTELSTGDERKEDTYGDKRTDCTGAQTIGDEGLVGMVTIQTI
jgi:hypothetical protein